MPEITGQFRLDHHRAGVACANTGKSCVVERDVVAVFGAGPVGLFAAKSAWLMGAGRVIVIDHLEYRLAKARAFAHAETYNFTEYDDIVMHTLGAGGWRRVLGRQANAPSPSSLTGKNSRCAMPPDQIPRHP